MRDFYLKITALFKTVNKRLSITKKVILLYILLIFIPACGLMYFYYQKTSIVIEKEVTNSLLQALDQIEINISYRLDNFRNISNSIFMNPQLHTLLIRNNNDIVQQIDDVKELRTILESAQASTDIFKVRLFVNNSKIYSDEKVNFFSLEDIQRKDWYKNIADENGRVYWKSTYLEHYIDSDDTYVISCARLLRDPTDFNSTMGVLMIDIPEKIFYNIISKIELAYKESIFILDNNGIVISYSDKSKIGGRILSNNDLKPLKGVKQGVYSIGEGLNKTFIIFNTIETTGWKIVVSIPETELAGKNKVINGVSGVVIIVITLVVFLLTLFLAFAFLAESITRRVKQMIEIMNKEGIENLNENMDSKSGDFNILESHVNSMLKTVHSLLEESYQAKINVREAQLKALQAQINPHFLYNTLDTINWMAIRINAQDINYMVDSLAKYFRLSLNKGRDIVNIADEINLARVYLELQQKRFLDSFTAEFEVDEEVNKYCMPKLILQPIIENALLHGIQKKKSRKGKIRIEVRKLEEDILFRISDDGVGMDTEMTVNLLSGNRKHMESESNGSSYGLYNVNERIRLFFGEGYGIHITSEKEKGTIVEVRIKGISGIYN